MKISELNPHIRYARIHQSYSHPGKYFSICYDCRVFYIEKAMGFVTVNEQKYNISNGTAIYFPPQTKYRFTFHNNTDFKVIVLDFDLINNFAYLNSSLGTATEKTFSLEKVPDYPLPQPLSTPIVKEMPQIYRTLVQCTENFLSKVSFYRESSSALLKLCLLEFIRENTKNARYSYVCEQVKNYIHENYANQTLSNSSIAEKFNYHPYHLSRIMKQETGKSLHRYLIDYRLNIAKNYLLTTQHHIDWISWESGFSSTAYFIKMFREQNGITPNKYRQIRFHTEL